MKFIHVLGFIILIGGGASVDEEKLSDADKCIAVMQHTLKHKNMTRTLGGLVGIGWDDMTNEYTLPVFKVTYKDCMADPDNTFLVPDNVYLIPIKKTALDKTSSVFNSFDEYKSRASNKLTISGSASAKGKGQASGSFSRETVDTKQSFVKVDSIMIQNKLLYLAYDLIGNEHGGLDASFIDRVKEIAAAVHGRNNLKAQFLAENLVANYGTHVIHKATAACEIVQNVFVKKVEEFKGEKHITEIKAGLSAEFDGQAYGGGGGVGVEDKQENEMNETTTTEHTKNTIHNRGGPDINRVGASNLTEAMLHVDNLIGINQIGKFLYDLIPAVPLLKYSRMTKYTVKNMVYDAIQEYYKHNTLPGCMDFLSDNYNPLANFEDGSCEAPGVLYSFGGIYQICNPIHSWANYDDVEFGKQCEENERRNRLTGNFSCPNGTDPILIDFDKIEFFDRTIKKEVRKCLRFLPLICWYEIKDVKVLDEIAVESYWCLRSNELDKTKHEIAQPNELDMIMRHQILNAIEENTELLKIFFPTLFNFKEQMQNQTVCTIKESDKANTEKITWKSVIEDFIEAGEGHYCRYPNYPGTPLNFTMKQLDMLAIYPKTLEALLPILDIREDLKKQKQNHNGIATTETLQNIYFNKSQTLLIQEDKQFAYFGGFFQNNNNNPFTGKPECPSYFEEINILENIKICVCYDIDREWPIRLGHIFHCFSKIKKCPKGYSEYLAGTIKGCEYKYCIRFHSRENIMKPVLSKPPFIKYERALLNDTKSSLPKNEF